MRKIAPHRKKAYRLLIRKTDFVSAFLSGGKPDWSKSPIFARRILRLLPLISIWRGPNTNLTFPTEDQVWETCLEIFRLKKAWPISFSLPSPQTLRTGSAKTKLTSSIVPGAPYKFRDYGKYLDEYGGSRFALTHKKGGWDCFRHLEIMLSGTVPIMPDAQSIPESCMVHYPKEAFAQVWTALKRGKARNLQSYGADFAEYASTALTSRSMADYILRASGIGRDSRILFFDETLPVRCDYLSAFTVIGLKQLLGKELFMQREVLYLYESWKGSPERLYGRGFGYSKVLPAELKVESNTRDLKDFDYVVVGDLLNNAEFVLENLESLGSKFVLIDGSDQGLSVEQIELFSRFGAKLFVRELN